MWYSNNDTGLTKLYNSTDQGIPGLYNNTNENIEAVYSIEDNGIINLYEKENVEESVILLLLDLYPNASVAYSLRYLSSNYTGDVILVRRSSDDAEQGFIPEEILDGTLETWVGAGNGFIKTWYDQSGNGRNVTQTTNSLQPAIILSGTLITANDLPGIWFTGTTYLTGPASTLIKTNASSVFSVLQPNFLGVDRYVFSQNDDVILQSISVTAQYNGSYNLDISGTLYGTGVASDIPSSLQVLSGNHNGSTLATYVNSLKRGERSLGLVTVPNSTFTISHNLYGYTGTLNEFVIYDSNKITTRALIERNMKEHYSI